MRTIPAVRPATVADLREVVALAATGPVETVPEVVLQHLSVFIGSGGQVLVVDTDAVEAAGDVAGSIVGFTLVRVLEPVMFSPTRAAIVDAIYVAPAARRHGIGHALILAVANLADEIEAPYVYAAPPTGDRGMQRFLARLGFAPVAGHRVVATATLQRRLADTVPTARARRARSGSTVVEEVIARRRRARTGLPTGVLDLRGIRSGNA